MSHGRKFVVRIDNNDVPTSIEETVDIRKWFVAGSPNPIEDLPDTGNPFVDLLHMIERGYKPDVDVVQLDKDGKEIARSTVRGITSATIKREEFRS